MGYAPKGRTEPGMWSLPDGEARYAAAVKSSTWMPEICVTGISQL
jgi:uncharacterized protein (DUF885 family)